MEYKMGNHNFPGHLECLTNELAPNLIGQLLCSELGLERNTESLLHPQSSSQEHNHGNQYSQQVITFKYRGMLWDKERSRGVKKFHKGGTETNHLTSRRTGKGLTNNNKSFTSIVRLPQIHSACSKAMCSRAL